MLMVADGNEPLAIIGMACRVPKANNLEEYWNNLISGIDCISKVKYLRKVASLYENSMKSHKLGCLSS